MNIYQKLQTRLYRGSKHWGRHISSLLGFEASRYRQTRGARILIYHGICRNDHTRFNPIFLTVAMLEAQLKCYKKHFNVISLDDYYQQRFSNDRFNICLTFDDGFANNHRYVLPLLEKYQLPATFFITAIRSTGNDVLWNDFLGIVSKYGPQQICFNQEKFFKGPHHKYISADSGRRLVDLLRADGFAVKTAIMQELYPLVPFRDMPAEQDYWLQLSEAEIRDMALSPWVSIGAHSVYHNDLALISASEAKAEMARSKTWLESLIQQPVNSFAFPYGAYNRGLVSQAKQLGYTQLLAMDFLFDEDQSDPTLRERLTVNPFISLPNQIHANLTGKYV